MTSERLLEAPLTRSIIGAFYEVYNTLGFGFLEAIYENALERELTSRGHIVRREVPVHIHYKEAEIGLHRLDFIVDQKVVVETKSTAELPKFARRQLLNYLRATNLEVGLLLHFGPEARFYRTVSETGAGNPFDPPSPHYPIRSGA